MVAIDAFWRLDSRSFHTINDAYMVLLPQSNATACIKDYRPISLIHSVDKLFSKILANRLTPKLPTLVHKSQSTFIQGRTIHDNFRLVQSSVRLLHARRVPSLLFKADMAWAFNSVAWPFVLEVLRHMGFPRTWLGWLSTIVSTTSTRVLLNSKPGERIYHARGLHQGDPLSPMLFLLVMEVLKGLIRKVDAWTILSSSLVVLFHTELPFTLMI
jgi:hypothetical protein